MVLLETRDLSCQRNNRVLFEHLDISLEGGQMLLVEGANGSGKTSLLRILTGLRLAESGAVLWRGEAIDRLAGDYFEQVSYVGHHDGLKRELSCLENLRMARAMGIPSTLSLDQALQQVRLYDYGETEVSQLSAGQQRRLALARLLVTDASLWILDEPFTSLDKDSMALFEALFERQLQQQGIIVMTSHHAVALPEQSLIRLELS